MFSFRSKPRYSSLEDAEYNDELKVGGISNPAPRHVTIEVSSCGIVSLIAALLLSAASISSFYLGRHTVGLSQVGSTAPARVSCIQPAVRQEWRTLSKPEKSAYISAVQCLSTQPSKLRDNGTLYDDFPWVHQLTAPTAHKSAPFFPWHRYYIHAYEEALKNECGFKGSLPYWDWSADWDNFESAPVWDDVEGFGGDGAEGETTVGEGRCVVDGKFAGLNAMFYEDKVNPHCLSRGFQKGDEMHKLCELIKPEAIDKVMQESDYDKFAHALEVRAHTFISHSIRGDFSKYTGPYDPVFFLHHTNLDRLWSKWQKVNPHRQFAYSGPATSLTSEPASVADTLDVGGLLEGISVSEVMETTSGPFCYQY